MMTWQQHLRPRYHGRGQCHVEGEADSSKCCADYAPWADPAVYAVYALCADYAECAFEVMYVRRRYGWGTEEIRRGTEEVRGWSRGGVGASYQVLVARRTLVVGLNCEILQVVAVEMQVDSTFEHIFPIDSQGVRLVLVPFGTGAEGVEMFWFVSWQKFQIS